MSAPNPECPGCPMLLAQVRQLAAELTDVRARLDAPGKQIVAVAGVKVASLGRRS